MKKYLHIRYLWLLLIGLFTVTISSCDDPLTGGMDPVRDAILDDSPNADPTVPISDFKPCLTIDKRLTTNLDDEGLSFEALDLEALGDDFTILHGTSLIEHEWGFDDTVFPYDETTPLSPVVIRVAFLDGTSDQRALVKQIAPEWSKHGAFLRFEFVEGGEADIRVGFDPYDGHWSYIGTDAKGINGKTMNLALLGERYPERVILHEFGHALGLVHEHQNPALSIQWNETAVIEELTRTQGWTVEQIRRNVLTPLGINQTNFTRFDPQSIMLYPIPQRWTIGDFETVYNIGLSDTDKVFIRTLYSSSKPVGPKPAGMVLIAAGEFVMGGLGALGADEKPLHTVYVDAFYMDAYEVTNAEYAEFLNAKGKHAEAGKEWYRIGHHWSRVEYVSRKYQVKGGYENHPVTMVSWYGAMAYAEWKGKRLPTEAEWEKAARGGLVGLEYPWGNSIDLSRANYNNYVGDTTTVGKYAANGYGLYDMSGNVSEWCLDEYDSNFYAISPSQNPLSGANSIQWLLDNYTGVNTSRVLRGGSWSNNASNVRCARRSSITPSNTISVYGFRCARTVSP